MLVPCFLAILLNVSPDLTVKNRARVSRAGGSGVVVSADFVEPE